MRTSNQKNLAPARRQEAQQADTVVVLKRMMGGEELKRRFSDILGKKAPQFMASIVNATAGNAQLQKCDPASIASAALVAATLDLPIDQNLGFSAIVPYGDKAQFQVMWKGFVQLAIRTGQYAGMNRAVIYEDEIKSYNPITGEVVFVDDFSETKQRLNGENDKIVGYYAWFELLNGFRQSLYMTRAEVEHHAMMYSKSYQSDKKYGKKNSRWSIDFDIMAEKTVIKRLLSQWGILSIEMQTAIKEDLKVYNADGSGTYADNPQNDAMLPETATPAATDADFTEIEPEPPVAEATVTDTAPDFGGTPFDDAGDEDVANLFNGG